MINLSYRFDQNSSSLELAGMPDVSKGDSEQTIGIISSWSLKIIGSPLLEGEKDHLDNLMQVVLQYSHSYISGIRQVFVSKRKIVTISPSGLNHKLLLNSTKKGINPLEIILDDSELSDLTRCFDLLRLDPRFNIKWDIQTELPFSKRYLYKNSNKSRLKFNLFYSLVIFLSACSLLVFIPVNNNYELEGYENISETFSDPIKFNILT